MEEMRPLLPEDVEYQVLEFGLHTTPQDLNRRLQTEIDASVPGVETIVLGYGLCSKAVVGLYANNCTLIIPRVDDCIAIFLGSSTAYKEQMHTSPGTYFLTKGWIEVGDTPFSQHKRLEQRYGSEKTQRLMRLMLKNYRRVALINTGQYEIERYRGYAQSAAKKFGLQYEEIQGAATLVQKMLFGPWDDEFVKIPPGQTVRLDHFLGS